MQFTFSFEILVLVCRCTYLLRLVMQAKCIVLLGIHSAHTRQYIYDYVESVVPGAIKVHKINEIICV